MDATLSPGTLRSALVDGKRAGALSGATLDVVNPATNTVIGRIPRCAASDVEVAVAAAKRAAPGWRSTDPQVHARNRIPYRKAEHSMDTTERLIAETAQANRALGASGQSDMVWGHASVRDPDGRGVWMKAAGWSFEEMTPDRIVLVSPDGEVLAGSGRRHIEYPIHTEVMNARPDVGSVVHTHAPAAVAFAALDEPLLAISHDGVEFAEPQIARFTRTGSLIKSAGLGWALAETIGDGVGCLVSRHGLVTVGPDAATAVMRAVLLARACHVQLQAMAAGQIRLWSDPAEIALKKAEVWPESQINAGYAYLCRQSGLAAEMVGP